jgi:uncharacterized DUF497 family protein
VCSRKRLAIRPTSGTDSTVRTASVLNDLALPPVAAAEISSITDRNIAKHGLTLVEGEGVKRSVGHHDRGWVLKRRASLDTVGANLGGELLVVVWTERDDGEQLISVRRATAKERKEYEG